MLWLGANVMLEYDTPDADALLTKNRTNALSSLEEVKEQLGKFTRLIFRTIEI